MRLSIRSLAVLTVLVVCPSSVHAADQGLDGVEVMTATVFEKGQSSFSGVGLRARLKSGTLASEVDVLPWIEYWRNATRIDAFNLKATRRDATIGCDVRWNFRAGNYRPYLGGGLGLHFLSAEVDAPGFDAANESVTKGAFALMTGLRMGEGDRFSEFIELRYHALPSAGQLKLHLGLSWNLGALSPPQ